MTSRIFEFGQTLPGYGVPVLNERAVRASAGILFFGAMVTFMQALGLSMFYLIVVQGVIGPINMLVVFALVMVGVGRWVSHGPDVWGMQHPSLHGQGSVQPAVQPAQTPASGADAERCKVPEFAKAMGHETIWKQHNGCL